MSLTKKKPLHEIVNEKLPTLKASILTIGEETLWYDAYADESEVEQLKDLLKELKVEIKIERRPF